MTCARSVNAIVTDTLTLKILQSFAPSVRRFGGRRVSRAVAGAENFAVMGRYIVLGILSISLTLALLPGAMR